MKTDTFFILAFLSFIHAAQWSSAAGNVAFYLIGIVFIVAGIAQFLWGEK